MERKTLIGILVAVLAACAQQIDTPRPEDARIEPESFPGLPQPIAADLRSRGCTIPQGYLDPNTHNAIRGEFRQPGQSDWAVLCSRDGGSTILVYWAGSTSAVAKLEPRDDRFHFERLSDGTILAGFTRQIVPVDHQHIRDAYETWREGPRPPPLDHQGIEDWYLEKAATILYWNKGEWVEWVGAD
jgi:hypothetical protein